MPLVRILARDQVTTFPAPRQAVEMAAVTYETDDLPPRVLFLELTSYRPATDAELARTPRYRLLPLDQKAALAEQGAIAADIQQATAPAPTTFELP